MKDPRLIFGRLGNSLFQYAYIYAQMKKGETPDIFVQDPKYFEQYADEIKKMFGEDIGYLPYVSVHLRVGKNPLNPGEPKYSENPFYVDLAKTGYYIDATNLFPNRKFLIFSDDNEFAKRYFEGDKFAFDESENEIEALNKMASCSDHIIANSSFSWWGAFLSPNIGKTVAPTVDKWYADGVERTSCPKDWIRV